MSCNGELDINQISFIHENTFASLRNLNYLWIDSNQIKVLKKGLFRDLTGLTSNLNLKSNKIEAIESGTFKDLLKLLKIDLSENRLNKIEKKSFQNLPYLNILDFSHNYLDQLIDVFGENVKINTLDLSFNFIRQLESCASVKILNLNIFSNGLKLIRGEFSKGTFLANVFNLNLGLNQLNHLVMLLMYCNIQVTF